MLSYKKQFIFLVFIVGLCSTPAIADNVLVDSILVRAQEKQSQRKTIEAVYEYCRALLIDFKQPIVINELQSIADKDNGFSAQEKIQLLQIISLIEDSNDIEKKIDYYQAKIGGMKQLSIDDVNINSISHENTFNKSMPSVSDKKMLEVAVQFLTENKEHLLAKYIALQDNLTELQAKPYQQPTRSFSSVVLSKESVEVALPTEQQANLYMQLQVKEGQLRDLSDQLVNLSLQVSEKEMLVEQYAEKLLRLNEQIVDVESRFKLGQKIIAEKDDQIVSLQTNLQEATKSLTKYKEYFTLAQTNFQSADIKQMAGFMEIYRGRLKDAYVENRLKDQSIKLMEERITYVKGIINQKHEQLEVAFNDLQKLKDQLQVMEEKTLVKRNPFEPQASKQDLASLNLWLNETQEFLSEQFEDFSSLQEYLSNTPEQD